jgi:hypothetical protein
MAAHNGREYDSGDAIQHPEWAFRACGDVAIQVKGYQTLIGGLDRMPLGSIVRFEAT